MPEQKVYNFIQRQGRNVLGDRGIVDLSFSPTVRGIFVQAFFDLPIPVHPVPKCQFSYYRFNSMWQRTLRYKAYINGKISKKSMHCFEMPL